MRMCRFRAIMFTDLEGSTAVSSQDGDRRVNGGDRPPERGSRQGTRAQVRRAAPHTSALLLRPRPPPRARTELAGSPAGELVSDPRSEVVPILSVVPLATTRRARRSISRVHSSRATAGSSTAQWSRLASNSAAMSALPRPAGHRLSEQGLRISAHGVTVADCARTTLGRTPTGAVSSPPAPRGRGGHARGGGTMLICPIICPTSRVRNGSIRRDTGRTPPDATTRKVVVDLGQYGTWRAQTTPGE